MRRRLWFQAQRDGEGGGFGAGVDVEFAEHALDVGFDGVFGNVQGPPDIAVRLSLRDQVENLNFAVAEAGLLFGRLGLPQKKWSTFIVRKGRIRNGEQTTQTRRNSDNAAAG